MPRTHDDYFAKRVLAYRSMDRAKSRSSFVSPPASWVESVTSTRFQTLNHSGWWFICSAMSAHWVMNAKASLKSLNWYERVMASRLVSIDHCERSVAMAKRSSELRRLAIVMLRSFVRPVDTKRLSEPPNGKRLRWVAASIWGVLPSPPLAQE